MDNGKWFFVIVENTYIGLGTKKTLRRFWVPEEHVTHPAWYYLNVLDHTGCMNGENCWAEDELMFQQTDQDGTNQPLAPLHLIIAMAAIGNTDKM